MPNRRLCALVARVLPFSVAVAAIASPAALAADAPSRALNLNAGQQLTENGPAIAIAPGGREVLLNQFDPDDPNRATNPGSRIVVRDVAAGRTTVLSDYDERALAASDDLQRILFSTKRAFTADDTNGAYDMYLYDRGAKTVQLVTRATTGGPALGFGKFEYSTALSGDGNSVLFTTGSRFSDPLAARMLVRFDAAAGTITRLASGAVMAFKGTDRAGRIALTEQGIYVGGTRLALPAGLTSRADREMVVSPNGRWVFTYDYSDGRNLVPTVVDTTTGATRVVPGDGPLASALVEVLGINDDGTTLLGNGAGRDGDRRQLARYDIATGAASNVGGTLPGNTSEVVVTKDWDFLAASTYLFQIGSTPIPGGSVTPTRPPAISHFSFWPGCRANPFNGKPAQRPRLTLRIPYGPDLSYPFPEPVKADLLVRVDATGALANVFSLPLWQTHELRAGFGGFTVIGSITFEDGSRVTVNTGVARYTPDYCA